MIFFGSLDGSVETRWDSRSVALVTKPCSEGVTPTRTGRQCDPVAYRPTSMTASPMWPSRNESSHITRYAASASAWPCHTDNVEVASDVDIGRSLCRPDEGLLTAPELQADTITTAILPRSTAATRRPPGTTNLAGYQTPPNGRKIL